MRQGQQNRRGRGRNNNSNSHNNNGGRDNREQRDNRKPQNSLSRSYESNGPDVKIRGTAAHIADKYTTLARDAMSSGDIITAENYLQHAEHYNRIIMAAQLAQAQQQPQMAERNAGDQPYPPERQGNGGAYAGSNAQQPAHGFNGNRDDRDDRDDADDPQPGQHSHLSFAQALNVQPAQRPRFDRERDRNAPRDGQRGVRDGQRDGDAQPPRYGAREGDGAQRPQPPRDYQQPPRDAGAERARDTRPQPPRETQQPQAAEPAAPSPQQPPADDTRRADASRSAPYAEPAAAREGDGSPRRRRRRVPEQGVDFRDDAPPAEMPADDKDVVD